jgi:hypothetical protein
LGNQPDQPVLIQNESFGMIGTTLEVGGGMLENEAMFRSNGITAAQGDQTYVHQIGGGSLNTLTTYNGNCTINCGDGTTQINANVWENLKASSYSYRPDATSSVFGKSEADLWLQTKKTK